MKPEHRPYTLIAELTYRCPLRCTYCSNPVDYAQHHTELEAATWVRVVREAEALGVVQVNLTGGEPLLREDLEVLVARCRDLNLYTNLITAGVPLTYERLLRLRDIGLDSVQLSIQSLDPAALAQITGGRWLDQKRATADWVKKLELPLTINVVLHRDNLHEIPDLITFAESLGADRLELANAQYLGWALVNRHGLLPTKKELDEARGIVSEARVRLRGRLDLLFVLPDYYSDLPRACMDGWGRRYIVVAPDGLVLPCHMARCLMGVGRLQFDNVCDAPLGAIWGDSVGFNRFRDEQWMPEPCRSCDRRQIDFGGCRCQAFLLTGDATVTDPACHLAPAHQLIKTARKETERTAEVPVILTHRQITGRHSK